MVWDLGAALLKKGEFETVRLLIRDPDGIGGGR